MKKGIINGGKFFGKLLSSMLKIIKGCLIGMKGGVG